MKLTKFLSAALVVGALALTAHAQNAAPLLWTSYVDTLGSYLRSNSEAAVVSRFTPGVAITVTRVQLQAVQGSGISGKGGYTRCSPVPKIRITDGTTKYAVAIPNGQINGRGYPSSVHADSGSIAYSFPVNASLVLRILPGETGCNPAGINVTVQYTVN